MLNHRFPGPIAAMSQGALRGSGCESLLVSTALITSFMDTELGDPEELERGTSLLIGAPRPSHSSRPGKTDDLSGAKWSGGEP
jgi:hypothetical protein